MLWILEHVDQLNTDAVLSLLPRISETRRAIVLSITHEPAKVRSVLAELLLRYALREEYGLTELPSIDTGDKGKPFFPDRPEICFNLSHCQTAVACALDASPLGVDVQEVRPLNAFPLSGRWHRASPASPMTDEAAPRASTAPPLYRVLSKTERAWVEAGETTDEQDCRFTAIWTCKEAYGKATGEGFLYDLRATAFRPKKRPWQQYGYTFRLLDLGDTFLALCASRPLRLRRVESAKLLSGFTEVIP